MIFLISDKLTPHPIEKTSEYQISWKIYEKLAPNTSYIRRQVISRMSASSVFFKQSSEFNTTKSELTTIEGDGLRVNLFVSKCQFRCVNCFNKLSQQAGYGEPFTKEHEKQLFEKLSLPFVDGLTFVGGEPFQNAVHLVNIAKSLKIKYPEKNIWSYTGYIIEILMGLDEDDPRRIFLNYIDVLIDGQYIDEERNEANLKVYRGSSNQRLIDVKKTIAQGKTIEYKRKET